jgi:hypothetical protein
VSLRLERGQDEPPNEAISANQKNAHLHSHHRKKKVF